MTFFINPYAHGPGGGGGITDPAFSSTVLLLGYEGADGSTSAVDESASSNGAATFNGNAQIDTAQFKFGASSLLLDGTGDYLSYADNADWDFITGDWTIETWVRFNSTSGFQNVIGRADGSANGPFNLDAVNGSILRFRYQLASEGMVNDQATWNYVTNTWYHLCIERSGNVFRSYADGVIITTHTWANNMADSSLGLYLGSLSNGTNTLNGWLDETRVTKGVARYGGAFTPPTAAFPRS